MDHNPSHTLAVQDVNTTQQVQEANLTAKDGLLIATECHLALFPDEDGDTALHLAVAQGDYEACRKLLDLFRIAGKSIDVRNKLLQTPLHVSIAANHKNIVKLLVGHGSDPNNPDRFGSTAFHLCAKYNNPDCLAEVFQNLGDRKPDLNVRDYEGLTALHVAVKSGSISTFKHLVQQGADIDAKDNKGGRTPLIYAIEMNERAIVELLLECDASVSQQTYSGDTALHIASGRGLQEIVRLLLRRGADATMKNTHSETPISLATSPSVSDILRTQYNPTASPETKALTMAHTQYASYLARNIPVPPNFLNFSASSNDKGSPPIVSRDQNPMQQRMRKLKLEHRGDEATPPKRPAIFAPQTLSLPFPGRESAIAIARSAVKVGEPVVLPRVFPIKHEYVEIQATQEEDGNSAGSSSRGSDNRDDEVMKQTPDFSDEHVEIAMEEVEVSAEEEVHKSDDESSPESHSSSIQDSPRKGGIYSGTQDLPYTHKLMQYSTNTLNKNLKDANNLDSKENILNKDNGNKPVIVQRQPQIDLASVLSREYRSNVEAETSYKSFTPSVSPGSAKPTQQGLMKSKSVPNSPQPAEANLYQLAREGLAVAAMANANPNQLSGREFGLSNYLKARPSRQAKIKSGTEELQNLALQGLAVAAMNAQSELFQKSTGKKKQKSAEEGDTPSNVPTAPKHFTQVLKPVKDGVPPMLHRSNSMPPKQYFEHETSPEALALINPLSSNNALLALAHANARKEHVGQAVSAKSMARSQSMVVPKLHPATTTVPLTTNEISENTKHSLRQAIMVKNPVTTPNGNQKLQPVEVYNPKKKKYQTYDPSGGIKIYDPKFPKSQSISIKILPTPVTVTPSTKFAKTEDPISGQLPGIPISHSTFTMPVAMPISAKRETTPNSPPRSLVKVSIPKTIIASTTVVSSSQQSSRYSADADSSPLNFTTPPPITEPPKTTILSQTVKTTKDSAPTHTVAPLQMPVNKGSVRKAESSGQPMVVSVAMAPVVTSRVASPTVQIPTTGPNPNTEADSNASSSSLSLSLPTSSVLPSTTFCNVTNGIPTLPHVALGGIQPQVLNPTLANLGLVGAHPASSYLQHQLAYVPHGKDLIPVIVPQAAFQPHVQLPSYAAAALQVQSTEDGTKTSVSTVSTNGDVHPYLDNVSKLPAIDPNLLYRMPLSLQDAQLRGLYPLYGTHLQQPLDALQQHHQNLLKNSLLYGQSLLPQHKLPVGTSPLTLTAVGGLTSKPVAAVSAVPVHRVATSKPSGSSVKMVVQNADDQPLNLSKKPTHEDQPLNLMKTHGAPKLSVHSDGSYRSSVIKAVSSIQSERPRTVRVDALNATTGVSDPHVIPPTHPGVYLPPVILNPAAAAVPHATQSAAISALSLPPIHYVNGMPFIFGAPSQM